MGCIYTKSDQVDLEMKDDGIYSVFQINTDTHKSRMLAQPGVTCPLLTEQTDARDMRLTQDVLVSQQHRVVDLRLSEPGLLVSGRENLDCNVLSLPLTPPHFPITALTWGEGGTEKKKRQTI